MHLITRLLSRAGDTLVGALSPDRSWRRSRRPRSRDAASESWRIAQPSLAHASIGPGKGPQLRKYDVA
jgi:hypothetical protein